MCKKSNSNRKPFKKYGISFQWFETIQLTKLEDIGDQYIRQCAEDRITIDKESKNNDFLTLIQKAFDADEKLFFFVHDSQMMFYPVFCIVLDITTSEEHSFSEEATFTISKKFNTFDSDTTKKKFLKMLYSEENKARILKYKLRFEPIGSYKY